MGAMVRIGLLFSTTGPYGVVGRSMLNGARLAVEEIAADPLFDFVFDAVLVDPGGSNVEVLRSDEKVPNGSVFQRMNLRGAEGGDLIKAAPAMHRPTTLSAQQFESLGIEWQQLAVKDTG